MDQFLRGRKFLFTSISLGPSMVQKVTWNNVLKSNNKLPVDRIMTMTDRARNVAVDFDHLLM